MGIRIIAVAVVAASLFGSSANAEYFYYVTPVSSANPVLYEVDPAGQIHTMLDLQSTGLATDGHGTLFSVLNSVVTRIGGGQVSTLANLDNNEFFQRIAADAQGNAYVANINSNFLIRIAPDGSQSVLVVPGFNPVIAVDPMGDVYSTVVTFLPSGPEISIYKSGTDGTVIDLLDNAPSDRFAADAAGNLYVLGNDSLLVVRSPQIANTVVSGLTNPSNLAVDPVTGAVFLTEDFKDASGKSNSVLGEVVNGAVVPIVQTSSNQDFQGAGYLVASPVPVDVPEPGVASWIGLALLGTLPRRRPVEGNVAGGQHS